MTQEPNFYCKKYLDLDYLYHCDQPCEDCKEVKETNSNQPVQPEGEKSNIIPRRIRLDQMKPSELAIYNAMQEVEKVGADVRLTKAVNLLDEAQNLVADYIDEKLNDKPQPQQEAKVIPEDVKEKILKKVKSVFRPDQLFDNRITAAVMCMVGEYGYSLALEKIAELEKKRLETWKQLQQLWELLDPSEEDSFCHDCADNSGICPYDNKPCDPHKRAVQSISNKDKKREKLETLLEEQFAFAYIRRYGNKDGLDEAWEEYNKENKLK